MATTAVRVVAVRVVAVRAVAVRVVAVRAVAVRAVAVTLLCVGGGEGRLLDGCPGADAGIQQGLVGSHQGISVAHLGLRVGRGLGGRGGEGAAQEGNDHEGAQHGITKGAAGAGREQGGGCERALGVEERRWGLRSVEKEDTHVLLLDSWKNR